MCPMAERVHVLVSHHHSPDEDLFTERLVHDLEATDADMWVDDKGITSGSFVQKISEGLMNRQWLVLVLVMSPAALKSEWVRDEVDMALNEIKAKRMLGVIPFVMLPCAEMEIPPL